MLLNEVMNVLKDVSEMVSLFSEEISESMKGVENYIFEEIEEKFDIKQKNGKFIGFLLCYKYITLVNLIVKSLTKVSKITENRLLTDQL